MFVVELAQNPTPRPRHFAFGAVHVEYSALRLQIIQWRLAPSRFEPHGAAGRRCGAGREPRGMCRPLGTGTSGQHGRLRHVCERTAPQGVGPHDGPRYKKETGSSCVPHGTLHAEAQLTTVVLLADSYPRTPALALCEARHSASHLSTFSPCRRTVDGEADRRAGSV